MIYSKNEINQETIKAVACFVSMIKKSLYEYNGIDEELIIMTIRYIRKMVKDNYRYI